MSMNYQRRRKVQKDYKWNVNHLQEFDSLETYDGLISEIIEPKSENPWSVPSLQEFLKFVCPECDFNSKDENEFHWHALENHDKAKEIWSKSVQNRYCEKEDKSQEVTEILWNAKTIKTDSIDVPIVDMIQNQNMVVELGSHKFQNIIEETGRLCGYNDFRDEFDRYSYDASLITYSYENIDLPVRKIDQITNIDENFDCVESNEGNKKRLKVLCDKLGYYLCPIKGCEANFKNAIHLHKHVINHPDLSKIKEEKLLKSTITNCKQCGWKPKNPDRTYGFELKLKKHIFYNHNTDHSNSKFICDICGKYFFDIIDLNRHMKFYHGDGDDILCSKCGQTLKNKNDLIKHRKKCQIKNRIMASCEICKKEFKGKDTLKTHMGRVHQNEALRTCHICEKVLVNRSELFKHYSKDHCDIENPVKVDGKYVFQCDYCEKILGSLNAKYTHVKLTHKIKLHISDIKVTKKQKCIYCSEENFSSKNFIIHLVNQHAGKDPSNELKNLEKGYRCIDCNEYYIMPMVYYRHLKYNHEKINESGENATSDTPTFADGV